MCHDCSDLVFQFGKRPMANNRDSYSRLGIGSHFRDTVHAKIKRSEEAIGALPQNNHCALALQRSSNTAKIQTYGVTRQAALALGYGGTVGRFLDKSTGATGYFTTSTFLAGVAGGSFAFEGAVYKGGLRNFVGGSDTASVGITTPIADIGFSSSRNISNGQEIGRGFTFSLKNPFTSPISVGAEATGGFAVTEIFGCKVPK